VLRKWRELIVCNAGMWRAVYDLRGNARLKLPNGRVAHAQIRSMSESGQTETSAGRFGMSGLPPIADIVRLRAQVRSVPQAVISQQVT
jgi:hypothetical protein